MAKFRLNPASVFTIAGQTVPCPTTITIDDVADDYVSECAALAAKEHVLGQRNISGSFSGEVESAGAASLAYIAVGVSGALVLRPASTTVGDIGITSTKLQITGRSLTTSTTGLTTYNCTFVCDDLTIAAISA